MGRVSKTNSGVPGNGMVSWEFEYIETATSLHRELAGLVGATVNKHGDMSLDSLLGRLHRLCSGLLVQRVMMFNRSNLLILFRLDIR